VKGMFQWVEKSGTSLKVAAASATDAVDLMVMIPFRGRDSNLSCTRSNKGFRFRLVRADGAMEISILSENQWNLDHINEPFPWPKNESFSY
jgi:hypothetical protein